MKWVFTVSAKTREPVFYFNIFLWLIFFIQFVLVFILYKNK